MAAKPRREPRVLAQLSPLDRLGALARKSGNLPPLGRAASALGHLGRGGLIWHATAPIVAARSQQSTPRGTLLSSIAIGTAFALSTTLAKAIERPRPCQQGERPLIPCPDGGSLPSDQAAAAFAAASMFAWLQPRLRRPLAIAATAMATARVTCGVHYPSDVIAGALIGTATACITQALAERRASDDAG
jgi:undecaprenyl-diphosphatase